MKMLKRLGLGVAALVITVVGYALTLDAIRWYNYKPDPRYDGKLTVRQIIELERQDNLKDEQARR